MNKGYILDGYPRNYEEARRVFAVNKETNENIIP